MIIWATALVGLTISMIIVASNVLVVMRAFITHTAITGMMSTIIGIKMTIL